ncbi:MAG: ankyrin repeat domain-containing protein [Wolbachia sp.]
MLIKHNAYIDTRDHNGQMSLHYAIQSGNTEVAKYLIDNGVNLNIKDAYSRILLHSAIYSGNCKLKI